MFVLFISRNTEHGHVKSPLWGKVELKLGTHVGASNIVRFTGGVRCALWRVPPPFSKTQIKGSLFCPKKGKCTVHRLWRVHVWRVVSSFKPSQEKHKVSSIGAVVAHWSYVPRVVGSIPIWSSSLLLYVSITFCDYLIAFLGGESPPKA